MQDKKVLLVYPGIKSGGFALPLGLLIVAQSLQKIGIGVSLFHYTTDNIKNLKYDNYLFVGISMLTGKIISNGLYIAKLIKNFNSKIPIVLGGVHPTLLPEESLRNELVDIVVIGEGDETVKELALCLLDNGDLSKVKGLAFKDTNKKIIVNPPREFIDLNTLDFDIPYYLLGKKFLYSYAIPIHTSRGCPYRCSFCYSVNFHKRKYRFKSAERVADEIEFIYKKYNIRIFDFGYEDEFFIDPFRACEIFKKIDAKGLKIAWTSFCRFDTFDRALNKIGSEFMELLKNSGCYFLSFGAESGSQRLLDEVIKKDIKVEQIFRTIDAMKTYKIPHRVNFIPDFPTETWDDIKTTFDVIDKISYNNSYIAVPIINLFPLPCTPILELVTRKYNFKPPTSLEEWAKFKMPFPYKNVTWNTKEHAKLCYNLSLMSVFPFHQDIKSYKIYKEFIYTSTSVYPSGYHSYILAKIQRWRYKHKLFNFNLECFLFMKLTNTITAIKRYIVNSILKKYLSVKQYNTLKEIFGSSDGTLKKIKESS